MDTNTIYVKEKLKAITLADMEAISQEVGVPFNTLKRIRYQETIDPRSATITPIFNHFKSKE